MATTYPLRRAVLRDGRPEAEVRYAEDDLPGALHLAALDEPAPGKAAAVVGIATLFPAPTELRPGRVAWRLRGMAVDPSVQGRGVGTALLDDAVARLRAEGAEVVWADGRDTALGFYERAGWRIEGDGFAVSIGHRDVAHHFVLLDL